MPIFQSVLFLDDMRIPLINGISHVRSYDEFVKWIEENGVPDLISFDHDLSNEHYPTGANLAGDYIPYESYKEKTGLHCVRWMIENQKFPKYWRVHSMNTQGRINIETELRRVAADGETHGLNIPYRIEYPL